MPHTINNIYKANECWIAYINSTITTIHLWIMANLDSNKTRIRNGDSRCGVVDTSRVSAGALWPFSVSDQNGLRKLRGSCVPCQNIPEEPISSGWVTSEGESLRSCTDLFSHRGPWYPSGQMHEGSLITTSKMQVAPLRQYESRGQGGPLGIADWDSVWAIEENQFFNRSSRLTQFEKNKRLLLQESSYY